MIAAKLSRLGMHTIIISICSLALGVVLTLAFQAYHTWAQTPLTGVTQETKKDFNVMVEAFKKKHSLTDEQVGSIIFWQGFSGFRYPFMVKGSIALGTGYQIPLTGEVNQISFNKKHAEETPFENIVGQREKTQLVLVDANQGRTLNAFDMPNNSNMANIEFVIFTPSEIKTFRMDTVYGVKYKRITSKKE